MTAAEKTTLARFLDTTLDALEGGYARPHAAYAFTDDGDTAGDPAPGQGRETTAGEAAGVTAGAAALGAAAGVTAGGDRGGAAGVTALPGDLAARIAACAACPLAGTRGHTVPGEGVANPLVMVIGEGPGADEDATGRPFVGAAGQLLDKMLASIGLSRERNCYIANVVKCRPPGNRDPAPGEIAACAPFLEEQIHALAPRALLCVGRVAACHVLGTDAPLGRFRGRFGAHDGPSGPIPVLATYHPSALLRNESWKAPAFDDLKLLMSRLLALDTVYAKETRELVERYAARDPVFAGRLREAGGDTVS